jgi:hypothetical protein
MIFSKFHLRHFITFICGKRYISYMLAYYHPPINLSDLSSTVVDYHPVDDIELKWKILSREERLFDIMDDISQQQMMFTADDISSRFSTH